jgi:predicted solute-binding protein
MIHARGSSDGDPRPHRARLGLVSYLNSRPIGYGLLRGRQKGRFEIVQRIPSELADALRAGSLDLALIPSVEYARARAAGSDAAIVPGIAIGSLGAAESVLLFSRAPIEAIRSVALDVSSRTSAALLRLLLRRRLRPGLPEPDLHPAAPDLPAMLERCDAALLIGDRALVAAREHQGQRGAGLTIVDLGAEWTAMTGRPFVFAFWAGPPREDSPEIVAALQDSLEEGIGRIPEIAREESGGDAEREALVVDYLTRAIRYRLGREELQGLAEFYAMLAVEGLLDAVPALCFHRTAACARDPR